MPETITVFETCPICGEKEPYTSVKAAPAPLPKDVEPSAAKEKQDESVCQKCWQELNLYVYGLTERIEGAALLVHLCDEQNPHAIALVKNLLGKNS